MLGKLGKHFSFAYLGPIEWDRSGTLVYGLWVHVAPGPTSLGRHSRARVDHRDLGRQDTSRSTPIDAPQLGRAAYDPVASWGQTAYFNLTVDLLKQMAASQKLELRVATADAGSIEYLPSADTRAPLADFIKARGITDD